MKPAIRALSTALPVLLCNLPPSVTAAENWPGPRGVGPRLNASPTPVQPAELSPLWSRSFQPVTFGPQEGPVDEMHLPGAYGAYNLTLLDGKLAFVGADGTGFPESAYLTVLDAAAGTTLNCVQIRGNTGSTRVYLWPYFGVCMSTDAMTGFGTIQWDPQTGTLFYAIGAYNTAYTAYNPLANAATYTAGKFQPGVPAYATLAEKHPGNEDAFGRTRADQETILGTPAPENITAGLQPWAWGPSGFVHDPENPKAKFDADWKTLFGNQGCSHYNTASWFALDPTGPALAIVKGAEWGHNTGGDAYVFNKYTGMKAVANWPTDMALPAPGLEKLRPFAHDGVLLANGRLFCIGAAEDRDGDNMLGVRRPEGLLPKVDQGLSIWAYDVTVEDLKPNDGATGFAADETLKLQPVFAHFLNSDYQPDPADLDTYGQSYYETDGLHRPKAMLADGNDLWVAWKPNEAGPASLVHATDSGVTSYPLNVGANRKGVDLWPKLSIVKTGDTKLFAFYTGYSSYRKRVMPEDPAAELAPFLHKGIPFPDAPAEEQADTFEKISRVGIWSSKLYPPRGPAEVAVFDPAAGKVKWTYNLTAAFPSLPANDFWTTIDRSQMVCAGKWMIVGWVDCSAPDAVLKLVSFDVTADTPDPVVRDIPLGFASQDYSKSALFDLIAANGTLYAQILKSDRLHVRDPRWSEQIILAVGAPQKAE